MVTYIHVTAQYRHVAVCSGLYPVRSPSLHGGYTPGCIESAMQASSTEKSSRTTLHYVIQNDSARDLVPPPPPPRVYSMSCGNFCTPFAGIYKQHAHWNVLYKTFRM